MTIWTDLNTAIDSYIANKGYVGTVEELGVDAPYDAELRSLLIMRSQVAAVTNSGGGGGGGAIEGIVNGFPVAVSGARLSYTETQLTAAATATTLRSKVGYPAISISYTVALNGSTSVTVRTEVSNDGTNWLNANLAGTDTTHTTSGTFGFVGTNQYQFVRFLFVSESGGTGATIDVIVALGQGFDGGNGLVEVTNLPSTLGLKIGAQSLSVIESEPEMLPFTSVCFERFATFTGTTLFEDVTEYSTNTQTLFTQVTTADALEIVSSSANDSAAGTNSRTVGVIYLNASGVWSQTIVTLNGTTAVPLTGITATAIISMSVLSGGVNQTSAGNIILRKVGTPLTIYEQITVGGNQSKSGRFTCPVGYYALITQLKLSADNQITEFAARSTRNQFNGTTTANDRYLFKQSIKLNAGAAIDLKCHDRIDAGQTYKISVIVSNVTARVFGSFDLKVIKL